MNTSEIKDDIKHNLSRIETAEDVAEALDIRYDTLRKTFRNSEGITIILAWGSPIHNVDIQSVYISKIEVSAIAILQECKIYVLI